MGSRQSKAGQQWDGGRHFDPDIASVLEWVLGWMEEGEQPCREELSPESPVTKALVEQWTDQRVPEGLEGCRDTGAHVVAG